MEVGVEGIIVSNHGGRQLDGAPATIDALEEVIIYIDNHFYTSDRKQKMPNY